MGMLRNARVLDADWVPGDVVHRNAEKNRLRDALGPVLDGERPQDLLLEGPSGAGKTCLARYTAARLEERALDLHTAYVDCWNHSTRYRVLVDVLEAVGRAADVHRNTPHDELLARLEALEAPVVVVLDEADQLAEPALLRELWAVPALTLVVIANDERDLLDPLDERVRSRFRSAVRVRFEGYSHNELVAIVRARADAALESGTVADEHLATIADAAAGNARDAITFLRHAAKEAEWEGADRIRTEHVRTAIPAARDDLRQRSLEKLTDDQRLLYDILREAGELSPGELYDRYRERATHPKTKRSVRSYLNKLEHYNLVEGTGTGPGRRYTSLAVPR